MLVKKFLFLYLTTPIWLIFLHSREYSRELFTQMFAEWFSPAYLHSREREHSWRSFGVIGRRDEWPRWISWSRSVWENYSVEPEPALLEVSIALPDPNIYRRSHNLKSRLLDLTTPCLRVFCHAWDGTYQELYQIRQRCDARIPLLDARGGVQCMPN